MLWRSWWNPARDPSMILYRSSSENLVERSSLRGPCMKILHMPCISGACMKSLLACLWEVLVSRSCKIRSSSRSFYDDLVGFSWGSMHEDLGQAFLQSLVTWSCSGPCQKILRRSCRNPLQEVPALGSSKCAAWLLVWSSSGMLIEVLVKRSCEIVYIENPSLRILWNSLRCPGTRFWQEVLMSWHGVASCDKASSFCCSYDNA